MNLIFKKMVHEDYNNKLDFFDFMKVCDSTVYFAGKALPVMEVVGIINPFAFNHQELITRMHDSMSDFRKSMPEWSAREYDYTNDRAGAYRAFEGIENGDFIVRDSNNSCSYEWHFQVMDGCVLVHTTISFTD